MDEFVSFLDGARARGAFVLRSLMSPPWSVRIEDRAPLSIFALVQGDAFVVPDHGDPVHVGPGDIAVVRGPLPYTVADRPDTAPQAVIHPGQHCTTPDGQDLEQTMTLGVRSWGNDPDGTTKMLIGTYEKAGEISQRLLDALPPIAVITAERWDTPLLALLGDEIVRDEPGQEVVLDRLLDLIVIGALRSWLARDDDTPAWYRATIDPVVAPAIRLLKNQPERAWTVASLAAEVGVSRAALARRFTDVVGEPPMTFLTDWRLALAADLLRESDATIASVAHQVGYGSPFALSTAFKRAYGVSPTRYRAGDPASLAAAAT